MEYTPSPSNDIGMSIQDKKIDSKLADIQSSKPIKFDNLFRILIEYIATHITQIRTDNMFKEAGIKSKAPQISTESINLLVDPKVLVKHFSLLQAVKKTVKIQKLEVEELTATEDFNCRQTCRILVVPGKIILQKHKSSNQKSAHNTLAILEFF
ncbi:hypothetical protein BB558_007173 [Smittium angustum]|uniref:Uncharacterized protein n=1 Tax=Smittium angustum TaxID=133377 RepID=A0A2U1IVT1_SMIAN|nr:hypothetical protein BB558_007173 [Smittium angustum]